MIQIYAFNSSFTAIFSSRYVKFQKIAIPSHFYSLLLFLYCLLFIISLVLVCLQIHHLLLFCSLSSPSSILHLHFGLCFFFSFLVLWLCVYMFLYCLLSIISLFLVYKFIVLCSSVLCLLHFPFYIFISLCSSSLSSWLSVYSLTTSSLCFVCCASFCYLLLFLVPCSYAYTLFLVFLFVLYHSVPSRYLFAVLL